MSAETEEAAVLVFLVDLTRPASRQSLRRVIRDEAFIHALRMSELLGTRYAAVLISATGRIVIPLIGPAELESCVALLGVLFDGCGGPDIVPLDLDPAVLQALEAAIGTRLLE